LGIASASNGVRRTADVWAHVQKCLEAERMFNDR
jgi:hypothetical protein